MPDLPTLPTLEGPTLAPVLGGRAEQLVILLHGVGADGNDLFGLAPYFQEILPGTLFISPDAPFSFDMGPFGYQWFSLRDMSPRARLDGVRETAPILDAFIDEKLIELGLGEDKLLLIGFSQGAMMALHVGLRRERRIAGIISYSGMLAGEELLAAEIKSRPPVLLTHGDADPVLPVAAIGRAEAALKAAGVPVEARIRPALAHGIDDECIRLGRGFIKSLFADLAGWRHKNAILQRLGKPRSLIVCSRPKKTRQPHKI